MRTIGLIGGMSWESTLDYYRIINTETAQRMGGLHSAQILLYSFDFEPIEALQRAEQWEELGSRLAAVARALELGGADLLLICTNTMHRVAGAVEEAVEIPLLHIADVVGRAITERGSSQVGLLGTRLTMEQDFYRRRLRDGFGIRAVTPDEQERKIIDEVIYDELCRGTVREESRQVFRKIIERLESRGAEGIILGCTEIPTLIGTEDSRVPVYNTAELHATAAVEFALESGRRND